MDVDTAARILKGEENGDRGEAVKRLCQYLRVDRSDVSYRQLIMGYEAEDFAKLEFIYDGYIRDGPSPDRLDAFEALCLQMAEHPFLLRQNKDISWDATTKSYVKNRTYHLAVARVKNVLMA